MKQEMLLVAGLTNTLIWISVDPDQLTLGLFDPFGTGLTSLMLMVLGENLSDLRIRESQSPGDDLDRHRLADRKIDGRNG